MMAHRLRSIRRALISDERYAPIRQNLLMQMQQRRNRAAVRAGTTPGTIFFAAELGRLLEHDATWLEATAAEYRATSSAWLRLSGLRSARRRTDGYSMAVDVAEGFALWALVKHVRPRVVVELGTQHGLTARLWKDALNAYVPDHVLYLCDLEDKRRFIAPNEAILIQGDGAESMRRIAAATQIDLLFNDAHPYPLIRDTLALGKECGVACFAFHDVSPNPQRGRPFRAASAQLDEAAREAHALDIAHCGHWERHGMADAFDSRILTQDYAENAAWRLQVFDSLFGVGVVLRRQPAG